MDRTGRRKHAELRQGRVASILLAFAIDAWWQQRSDSQQAWAITAGLRNDFQTSQAHLEAWQAGNRRILAASKELLQLIRTAERDPKISVPTELIIGVIGAPTYSPTDSGLEVAFATGQIELIEDGRLLSLLGVWRQQLADTSEDELLLREIVVKQLVPEIATQVRLADAFDFDTLTGWFRGRPEIKQNDSLELLATSRLEGILAQRVFYTTFVVRGLADMRATQASILELLAALTHQ